MVVNIVSSHPKNIADILESNISRVIYYPTSLSPDSFPPPPGRGLGLGVAWKKVCTVDYGALVASSDCTDSERATPLSQTINLVIFIEVAHTVPTRLHPR